MDVNNILFEFHFVPFQCQCQVSGLEVNQDTHRHPPGLATMWTGGCGAKFKLTFFLYGAKI